MRSKFKDIGQDARTSAKMTAKMHALQLKRLEGLGKEPSQEELGAMRRPQRSCQLVG